MRSFPEPAGPEPLSTHRSLEDSPSVSGSPQRASYARRIIVRSAHLVSAQAFDGILSGVFLLYLAWVDKTFFGEIAIGLAAGTIAGKVVQFGLYYPLVTDLSRADRREQCATVNVVNVLQFCFLVISLAAVWAIAGYRGYYPRLAWIVLMVTLGQGLEAVAEPFFADLRVRGLQRTEARIKYGSAIASYGYGMVAISIGLVPEAVAAFKVVGGLIRVIFGFVAHLSPNPSCLFVKPRFDSVRTMFLRTLIFALIQILGVAYNKLNVFFLEKASGIDAVALYSAVYGLVDPLSTMASEQLLGGVVFPLLAVVWWKSRQELGTLVRNTALWLIVLSFPAMFLLYAESDLMVGLIFPAGYSESAGFQKYLVWTIVLSTQSNLFQYVMVVSGAQKMLLAFQAATTVVNIVCNLLLVERFGAVGACLVIVFTKLAMTIFSFVYCQARFGFFRFSDFLFPLVLGSVGLGAFFAMEPFLGRHLAVALITVTYLATVWQLGTKYLGYFPKRTEDGPAPQVGCDRQG